MTKPDIATATIARRRPACDEAGLLEHPEVVGEQVAPEAVPGGQRTGGAVADHEVVDDRQTDWITKGGMAACSGVDVHASTISVNIS